MLQGGLMFLMLILIGIIAFVICLLCVNPSLHKRLGQGIRRLKNPDLAVEDEPLFEAYASAEGNLDAEVTGEQNLDPNTNPGTEQDGEQDLDPGTEQDGEQDLDPGTVRGASSDSTGNLPGIENGLENTYEPGFYVNPDAVIRDGYYIRVNRQANTVTVYTYDEAGEPTVPVRAMVCSVGECWSTPTGIYHMSTKYRWRELLGHVYGQYAIRIYKGIMFHSVPYRRTRPNTLVAGEYNKLGENASHGCIRLCVRDVKWIYDTIPSKTTVEIYDSEDPGPLGKPEIIPVPEEDERAGWDPTDTDPENPFFTGVEESNQEACVEMDRRQSKRRTADQAEDGGRRMTDRELMEEAVKAREYSYAPYSNCHVGAALLSKDGRVFRGCNIENAAFGPTNCAERTAIFKAISEGVRDFEKIAVVGGRGEQISGHYPPCGVCRQVLREFCPDTEHFVVLLGTPEEIKSFTLEELLPESFGPDDVTSI